MENNTAVQVELMRLEKAYSESVIEQDDLDALSHLYTTDSYFSEAYFGKSQNLVKCEDILKKMQALVKTKTSVDLTNHMYNKALSKALEDEFGFAQVHITWYRTRVTDLAGALSTGNIVGPIAQATYVDVYTIPSVNIFIRNPTAFIKNPLKKGKRYYDTNHSLVVSISVSMATIRYDVLTPAELLACILHEIGHNFDTSVYRMSSLIMHFATVFFGTLGVTSAMASVGSLSDESGPIYAGLATAASAFSMSTPMRKITNALDNFFAKLANSIPGMKEFFDTMTRGMDVLKEVGAVIGFYTVIPALGFAAKFGTSLRGIRNRLRSTLDLSDTEIQALSGLAIIGLLHMVTEKKEEIFADSFATAYGYGVELASALNKLDMSDMKHMRKLPKQFIITKLVMDFQASCDLIFQDFINPGHGSSITRANKILQIQKKNLAQQTDLTPALRKELEDQIAIMEKFIATRPIESRKEGLLFTGALQWFISRVCRGNPFIFERILPDVRA